MHELKSQELIEAVSMVSFDSMLSKHIACLRSALFAYPTKKLEDGPPKSFTITKEKIRKVSAVVNALT